jgi:cellulose synthase operon protein C
LIEGQGRLADAADLLTDLRARHPDHALVGSASNRLADLYERADVKDRAAEEYQRVAESDPDPEVRRVSLYRAGELYLDTQNPGAAAATFEAYVSTYREPADLRLEAIDHLDRLAQQTNDGAARRRWMGEKISLVAGQAAPTDRMRFEAAEAQTFLADEARQNFSALALVPPLDKSLVHKRDALNVAVDAYQKAASYDVQQFATQSTYWIAQIYADLSKALLKSARPAGLSELELEQYDVLLEEQAFPFEEQAIEIHEVNLRRSWEGVYDEWIQRSFGALRELMPGRFDKRELQVAYVEPIE